MHPHLACSPNSLYLEDENSNSFIDIPFPFLEQLEDNDVNYVILEFSTCAHDWAVVDVKSTTNFFQLPIRMANFLGRRPWFSLLVAIERISHNLSFLLVQKRWRYIVRGLTYSVYIYYIVGVKYFSIDVSQIQQKKKGWERNIEFR